CDKPLCGLLVTLLREEEIDGLALFIHRAIQIAPLTLHLDVGFIHPPTDPDRPLVAVECLLQLRAVLHDPPVDRGVIDLHPAFLHEFFDVACAQWVRYVPADPHENDLFGEMRPFETDCHRRSPQLATWVGGRDHTTNRLKRKLATEPLLVPTRL